MRIIITGGGTGGHLSVAEALANAAVERGHELIYVGSTSGQDQSWFADHDAFYKHFFLASSGVVNKRGLAKIKTLFTIARSVLHVRKIIKKEKVDAVLSVGGYSAAPASFCALLMRKPLYIQEQNARSGRLNSLLKKYAKAFFSFYERDSEVQAYPTQAIFFKKARIRSSVKTIIFLGGSQGAMFINDLALGVAKTLQERGIHIIHQCGKADEERVSEAYKTLGVDVELYGFTHKLDELITRADLAVSRAGASTLFELISNGLPALYIPYPYAASDHQFYNALFLLKKELSWCERESEDVKGRLLDVVDRDMSKMSKALMQINEKDCAQKIIQVIEDDKS